MTASERALSCVDHVSAPYKFLNYYYYTIIINIIIIIIIIIIMTIYYYYYYSSLPLSTYPASTEGCIRTSAITS